MKAFWKRRHERQRQQVQYAAIEARYARENKDSVFRQLVPMPPVAEAVKWNITMVTMPIVYAPKKNLVFMNLTDDDEEKIK